VKREMPRQGGYKHTEETKRRIKEAVNRPEIKRKQSEARKGITLEEQGHKPNCQCSGCKIKREEWKGDKHPNWTGGGADYWKRKSRKAWEKHHGRKIPKGMVIHHIDGDRTNIDPANLQLRTNRGHGRWHQRIKKLIDRIEKIVNP
jgi:hypothetical protein